MIGPPCDTMQTLAPTPNVEAVLARASVVSARLTLQVRAAALRPPVPRLRELDVLDAGTADGLHVPAITSLAA